MRKTICGLAMLMSIGCLPLNDAMAKPPTSIERHINKEPTYESKPEYCLFAFGQTGQKRVWLVKDGDALFLDRNGNGDLTEEGERLTPSKRRDLNADYRDVDYPDIQIDLPKTVGTGRQTATLEIGYYQMAGKPIHHVVKLKVDGAYRKYVGWQPIFSPKMEDANVYFFDGPLSPRHLRKKQISLSGEKEELHLSFASQGLGENARVMLAYEAVAKDVVPVADIEWPSANSDKTVRSQVKLVERC